LGYYNTQKQGMSLDNAEIDLETLLVMNGYVAFLEQNLEGISLVGYSEESLQVDPVVLNLDQDLQNQSYQNDFCLKN
jgi:hypothetical protein